ncbi:hypothetical protein AVEN_32444-1 [Araneus ventricosus]|uniref:Uncharacterized protein n=1 Tax=Araneus ventricosus TaxID=182803 RepID=A0A4Y2NUD6_ARAVE|nr:hypothetical protein AVEN_32444-1 [Araneus ventricosus]
MMIEKVEHKVQGKIGNIERRLSELESKPHGSSLHPEFMYSRLTVKPLTFDGLTSFAVLGLSLTNLTTIEKALESRCGDSDLTKCYRTELKTRRQKPGESFQELAADMKRLMSLEYAECSLDVPESLAAQYFVDAIRDEDTRYSTRLMDAKDLT